MATRQQIIDEIWSSGGFPTARATSVAVGVASPLATNSANLASVNQYTIQMTDNQEGAFELNFPAVWIPTASNSRLAIYGTGHTARFDVGGHDDMIRALTTEGYTVIGVHMPFASATSANETVANHNSLPQRTARRNCLRFFLEPAIRALNEIGAGNFSRVCGMGLSGGGWLMSILPAIDTRIDRSISVAGSFPLTISEPSRDWEQFLPGLADVLGVDYPDLYTLSCSEGRKHLQLLNTLDSCCFKHSQYNNQAYRMQIRLLTEKRYNLTFDSTHSSHIVSEFARNLAISFFGS